jgi:putative sigma-54 modulation protein
MQLRVTARHFDLTDKLREHVESRSRHLERFFNNIIDLHWVLEIDKHRHIADLSARVYGNVLTGRAETSDLRTSVDEVTDKMEGQLKRYKSRLKDRDQRSVAEGKGTQPLSTETTEADEA